MKENETSDRMRSGQMPTGMLMSEVIIKKHFSGNTEDAAIGIKAAQGAENGFAIGGKVGAIAAIISTIGTSLANIKS